MIKKIWEKPELNELGVKDTKSASNINVAFKVSRSKVRNGETQYKSSSSSSDSKNKPSKPNNPK